MSSPIPPVGGPQPIHPQVVWEPQAAPVARDCRAVTGVVRPLGRRLLWAALVISILINLSNLGKTAEYLQPEGELNERYHSLEQEGPRQSRHR